MIGPHDRILKDGIEFDEFSKYQASALENTTVAGSIMTVHADPLPKKAWSALAGHFKKLARKAQEPAIEDRWRCIRALCLKMPDGSSQWDFMVMMWEVEQQTKQPLCDGVSRGMFREEAYKFMMKEFAGRQVG